MSINKIQKKRKVKTVSHQEKDILWAKNELDKMMGFEKWKDENNPSQYFIDLYKKSRKELELIASGKKKIIRGVRITNNKKGQRVEYF